MKTRHFFSVLLALVFFFSCGKEAPVEKKDNITLTSAKLVSIKSEGGSANLSFYSSGKWSVSVEPAVKWLTIEKTSGEEGNIALLLTVAENTVTEERRSVVKLSCGNSSVSVTVVQEAYKAPYQPITIYYDNLDKNPSYSGYLSDFSWRNPVGEGVSELSYDSWNAGLRNDDYGSTGKIGSYDGASGVCYARITQSNNGVFGHLDIVNISTCTYRNFTFSFGAAQGRDVLTLEVSPDGGNSWTELEYSFDGSYNKWSKASVAFSVGSAVTSLNFKFTLKGAKASYAYGANIDDIRLETAENSSETVIGKDKGAGPWPYAELPVIDRTNPDYYYNTLYATSVRSGKKIRNYSFCYDTRRHNPVWVAFPMHDLYAEGSGRSKDEKGYDPWRRYPDLEIEQQSIIWDITGDGYHQYWSYSSAIINYRTQWGKGHLCMSSSRAGAGSELNLQTFYPVNIAPQAGGPVFPAVWAETENFHYQRGSQVCPDTLYVVAGCHYENDDNIEYDACYRLETSSCSKPCVMPTHQYKLFLRTRNGYTGKPVQACEAVELMTIGFWIDSVPADDASTTLSDYAVSVAEIERRTGFTFFPDIPPEVKSQCSPGDWGI